VAQEANNLTGALNSHGGAQSTPALEKGTPLTLWRPFTNRLTGKVQNGEA
jgi:hypothetical protein